VTEGETAGDRLAAVRDETLRRIAELQREFDGIVASAAGGSSGGDDEHDPEGATVAFERQHIAALLAAAQSQLAAIDAAFRKLDAGVYGVCDVCGGPIGSARLEARPAALTCVRCASRSILLSRKQLLPWVGFASKFAAHNGAKRSPNSSQSTQSRRGEVHVTDEASARRRQARLMWRTGRAWGDGRRACCA
jgi:DnaK suppressor protein